jgi:mono/diheme cytochrome c family protein
MRIHVAIACVLLAACTSSSPPSTGDDDGDDDGAADPFAPQADTSEGLTNVSADLDAVLEHGALATACTDAAADPTDRRKRLLCGTAMFFDESFGTVGVPKPILTWLVADFPAEVGPGFTDLGMVADPRSPDGLPIGFGAAEPLGSIDTVSFTCASCHFAQLPDGRYAVGAPNLGYDYGRMILMASVLPALSIPGADPAAHDPDAIAALQPLRDRMAADSSIQTDLITALLPLITGGGAMPMFSAENEHWYAHWRTGTMDFFIEPLAFDDQVHTVSKISSLWGLPDEAELTAAGGHSAMLGWTGGTASVANFLAGFVDLGGGVLDDWPADRLAPLEEYIRSLRAPEPPTPDADVARGRALFVDDCQGCHGGPRGMGVELYGYDELGTDDAMTWWADGPDHDGELCCGLRLQPGDSITHAIKSPRLVGLWAMDRFLHNGSVDSLDQLLCRTPRAGITAPAFGDGGHEYGCELDDADRAALVAYLAAH